MFQYPDTIRKAVTGDIRALSQRMGYHLAKYRVPEMWMETQGEGVTVAVLDTGCQVDHEDLVGSFSTTRNCVEVARLRSLKQKGKRTSSKMSKQNVDQQIESMSSNVEDRDGHGTHVCGIISANNNQIGVVGVAPEAKIIPIKVLGDDGCGSYESIVAGIDAAIELKADIINMSLGSTSNSPDLYAAVRRAYDANIPIICAAGNRGIRSLDFPAQYRETISVGALDPQNVKAVFSQVGPNLDFMAPGVDILSTVPVNGYMLMSGTSMASPWIAGVVALLMSKHRQCQTNQTPLSSVEDVREHLRRMSVKIDDLGTEPDKGFGLVDVSKMREDFVTALSLDDRFRVLQEKVMMLEQKLIDIGAKVV